MEYLTIKDGVILNPLLESVIQSFKSWFNDKKFPVRVSSGLRTPEHQLEIIKGFVKNAAIDKNFPELEGCNLTDKFMFEDVNSLWLNEQVYHWQPAWSKLLSLYGENPSKYKVVDPPLDAICLYDYIHKGKNLRGILFHPSAHIKGEAFDLDPEGSLDDLASIVEAIYTSRSIRNFAGFLKEPANGSVHCDCRV